MSVSAKYSATRISMSTTILKIISKLFQFHIFVVLVSDISRLSELQIHGMYETECLIGY